MKTINSCSIWKNYRRTNKSGVAKSWRRWFANFTSDLPGRNIAAIWFGRKGKQNRNRLWPGYFPRERRPTHFSRKKASPTRAEVCGPHLAKAIELRLKSYPKAEQRLSHRHR